MHALFHIPKTAGTTIRRQLRDTPGLSVLRIHTHAALQARYSQNIPALRRDSTIYDVMTDHIVYREWWVAMVDVLFSVVRDPVRRSISQVNFIRATPEHDQHVFLHAKGFKAAFASDTRFAQRFRDSQFRSLFGQKAYNDLKGQPPDDDILKALFAKHRYLVGCFEEFPDFCTLLNNRLGFSVDPDIRYKVRMKDEDYVFDADDLAMARNSNRIDQALFDFVRARGTVDTTAPT